MVHQKDITTISWILPECLWDFRTFTHWKTTLRWRALIGKPHLIDKMLCLCIWQMLLSKATYRSAGRVRGGGSCLRTPTGGRTFHAGDLNPGLPHGLVIIPLHYPVPGLDAGHMIIKRETFPHHGAAMTSAYLWISRGCEKNFKCFCPDSGPFLSLTQRCYRLNPTRKCFSE